MSSLVRRTGNEPDVEPSRLRPVTTLGRGSYGKVVLAEYPRLSSGADSPTSELVAVKVVAKGRLKSKGHTEKAMTELRVMREVAPTSDFLIGCRGAFQTSNALFYVMPYSGGGEVFFHLQQQGRFKDAKARVLAMQVVLGLEALHAFGIVYRDLKPENVLLTADGRAQLADFGLAKFLPKIEIKSKVAAPKRRSFSLFGRKKQAAASGNNDDEVTSSSETHYWWGTTKTRCGTPAYQAPEVIQAADHGLEVDFWTLGVLIYEMLAGDPPFLASEVKAVYALVLGGTLAFPPKRFTDQSKSLITALLTQDRKLRLGYGEIDCEAIKAHPWFTSPASSSKVTTPATWDSVANLTCSAAIQPIEIGLGDPRDAIFFHAEFTSEDVREYIAPVNKLGASQQVMLAGANFKLFAPVDDAAFSGFVSDVPTVNVEKGDVDPTDLAAKGIVVNPPPAKPLDD